MKNDQDMQKRNRSRGQSANAFTLPEMLAVIAIIVILVSILLPALSKAKYSAKLALCANNQRQLGIAVLSYTADQRRMYPSRLGGDQGGVAATELRYGLGDDRPALRDYFNINLLFNDPLAPEWFDYDASTASWVQPPIGMYWGWRITGESEGMFRVGNKWTYNGSTFNVLATDLDSLYPSLAAVSSHRDKAGVLRAIKGDGPGHVGTSRWQYNGTAVRGNLDVNTLFDDGSVQRSSNRKAHDSKDNFKPVPIHANNHIYWGSHYVPSMD